MGIATPALRNDFERIDDTFQYTEFAVDWREPLPRARFGNQRFMWGCVALSVLVAWMVSR